MELFNFKSLIRDKWRLEITDEAGRVKTSEINNRTVIKTNERIVYEGLNHKIMVMRDIGEKIVRFTDMETKQILAHASYESITKFTSIDVTIFNESLTIYEVACIYLLLRVKH
jgi:hypothetical protein